MSEEEISFNRLTDLGQALRRRDEAIAERDALKEKLVIERGDCLEAIAKLDATQAEVAKLREQVEHLTVAMSFTDAAWELDTKQRIDEAGAERDAAMAKLKEACEHIERMATEGVSRACGDDDAFAFLKTIDPKRWGDE